MRETNYDTPYCMMASGMHLDRLEEIIKTALSLTDAETRYATRQNSVEVICKIDADREVKLVITGMKIEGNNIVLLLNREF